MLKILSLALALAAPTPVIPILAAQSGVDGEDLADAVELEFNYIEMED